MTVYDTTIPVQLSTKVDNSTIEVSSGKLQIKDDGITALKIDVAGLDGTSGLTTGDGTNLTGVGTRVAEISTSTDLNISINDSATTDENNIELSAVASGDIGEADYIKIRVVGFGKYRQKVTGTGTITIKAQIKEIAGAYADVIAYRDVLSRSTQFPTGTGVTSGLITYEILHELTAGEKTNGFQIKIFVKGVTTNAEDSMIYTHLQSSLELI